MIAATTRAALLRGTNALDALGDEIEDNGATVAGFDDFPCSIIERDAREFDQASQTWRTIRKLTGRVPSDVDVRAGDRIKDLRDGAIYAVDGFESMARGLSGRSSVTLKLRRTTP